MIEFNEKNSDEVAHRQHVSSYAISLKDLIHRDSYNRYVRLDSDQNLAFYYEAFVRLMQMSDSSVEIIVFEEKRQILVQFVLKSCFFSCL
jgi:hypothetical protein